MVTFYSLINFIILKNYNKLKKHIDLFLLKEFSTKLNIKYKLFATVSFSLVIDKANSQLTFNRVMLSTKLIIKNLSFIFIKWVQIKSTPIYKINIIKIIKKLFFNLS